MVSSIFKDKNDYQQEIGLQTCYQYTSPICLDVEENNNKNRPLYYIDQAG